MAPLKEWMQPELIWFIAGIALLIAEFAIPGLVIFFFGVGALLVATLCFLFDLSLNAQLLIFLLSSLILLLSLRRWMKKIFMGRTSAQAELDDNLSDFIGRRAVVIQKITPTLPGKVDFNGTRWTAEAGYPISKGEAVEIIGKDNLTLKVQRISFRVNPHKSDKGEQP